METTTPPSNREVRRREKSQKEISTSPKLVRCKMLQAYVRNHFDPSFFKRHLEESIKGVTLLVATRDFANGLEGFKAALGTCFGLHLPNSTLLTQGVAQSQNPHLIAIHPQHPTSHTTASRASVSFEWPPRISPRCSALHKDDE